MVMLHDYMLLPALTFTKLLPIPVIGVIEPGARTAIMTTKIKMY